MCICAKEHGDRLQPLTNAWLSLVNNLEQKQTQDIRYDFPLESGKQTELISGVEIGEQGRGR